MKEITVISGKGGTGKTTVTAAMASLGNKLVLSDNDAQLTHAILNRNPSNNGKPMLVVF